MEEIGITDFEEKSNEKINDTLPFEIIKIQVNYIIFNYIEINFIRKDI